MKVSFKAFFHIYFLEIVLTINKKLQLKVIFQIALFWFSEIVMIMINWDPLSNHTRD